MATPSQAVPVSRTPASEPSVFPFDRADCWNPQAERYFFAEGSLVPKSVSPSADVLIRRSYSGVLARMSEPSLSCVAPAHDAYRLLILPTWGAAVAVRVEGAQLSHVMLDGEAGFAPGKVARRFTRQLRALEQRKFTAALLKAEFWTTPPNDFDRMGNDGTTWVIEGRAGNSYRVVQRWMPESGSFWELGRLALGLAGCDPEAVTDGPKRTVPLCKPPR